MDPRVCASTLNHQLENRNQNAAHSPNANKQAQAQTSSSRHLSRSSPIPERQSIERHQHREMMSLLLNPQHHQLQSLAYELLTPWTKPKSLNPQNPKPRALQPEPDKVQAVFPLSKRTKGFPS